MKKSGPVIFIYCVCFLAMGVLAACSTGKKETVRMIESDITDTIKEPVDTGRGPLPAEFRTKKTFTKNKLPQIRIDPPNAPPEVDVLLKTPDKKEKVALTKISVNLKNASVGNVALILGEASGINFVVSQNAKDAKTADMKLRNVTWIKAFETITEASNLVATNNGEDIFTHGMQEPASGSVIVITRVEDHINNLANREKSADAAMKIIQREQKIKEGKFASKKFIENAERIIKTHKFRYADPEEALAYLTQLFTDYDKETLKSVNVASDISGERRRQSNRGDSRHSFDTEKNRNKNAVKFSLYRAENLITITASVRKMKIIMKNIKEIDVAPKQVYIIARIVEVQRNHVKDIGIQWGGYTAMTTGYKLANTVGISGASGTNVVSLPPQSSVDPATGALLSSPQGGAIGITLGSISGAALLNAKLFALERAGVSKTISNPKIVALNGKQAYIKSGREIPYQSSSANTGVNIRFKEAVISLSVTPLIMENNQIRMEIKAKKDEVDTTLSVLGVPSIKKKELVTTVVVESGGSVVLGGVFEGLEGNQQNRTPWLHKIPGLGWLFKNDRKTDNELELLVFITPTIVDGGKM